MSCDHELTNEKTRCSGKNASYITIDFNFFFTSPLVMSFLRGAPPPKKNPGSAPDWICHFEDRLKRIYTGPIALSSNYLSARSTGQEFYFEINWHWEWRMERRVNLKVFKHSLALQKRNWLSVVLKLTLLTILCFLKIQATSAKSSRETDNKLRYFYAI